MGTGTQRKVGTRTDDALLDEIQRETFEYFLHEVNERNGLVADCTRPGWPCSIAATGLGLASYPVGVNRAWITRAEAIARTLAALEFFAGSAQGAAADATGYRGFYYHFLDMQTGRRTWDSEVSTIDSTFLIAGALLAAEYFDRPTDGERRIRELADALYRRMDWHWAQNGGEAVSHGWKPESGFLPYRWQGYCEALLLYAFGLGSPTYPDRAKSTSRASGDDSWGMPRAARRSVPTTGRLRRGSSSHRCRLPRKWSCRRSGT